MRITRQQQETLRKKWKQNPDGRTFLQFRRSTVPVMGWGRTTKMSLIKDRASASDGLRLTHCDSPIAVRWCSMWLCIEDDGYCHT